jgi:hypothetical protein
VFPDRFGEAVDAGGDFLVWDLAEGEAEVVFGELAGGGVGLEAVVAGDVEDAVF